MIIQQRVDNTAEPLGTIFLNHKEEIVVDMPTQLKSKFEAGFPLYNKKTKETKKISSKDESKLYLLALINYFMRSSVIFLVEEPKDAKWMRETMEWAKKEYGNENS